MLRLAARTQHYAWGSRTAIPELLGTPVTGEPVAELWLGTHPAGPSRALTADGEVLLGDLIASDPATMLGTQVAHRFGALPYLLKVIAAAEPLSLQVHPDLDRARVGFAQEEAAGIPVSAPERTYRDRNHKPELLYPLTPFRALCGFRRPADAVALLEGLGTPLAAEVVAALTGGVDPVRTALELLLAPATRPDPAAVMDLAGACVARLSRGSPDPDADGTVALLADAYPGDPGVVVSLLLNHIRLAPGQAVYVPAGTIHSYLDGVAVELMAASDNVLRAGLTPKQIAVEELLAAVDATSAKPSRVAAEPVGEAVEVFSVPVPDFRLAAVSVADGIARPVPGDGPRALLCLDGDVTVRSADSALVLTRGESAFVPASEREVTARGHGRLVQADVPVSPDPSAR